jgi:hypothetical protein
LNADDSRQLDFIISFSYGQMDCLTDPCTNPTSYTHKSMSLINGYSVLDLTDKSTTLFDSINI